MQDTSYMALFICYHEMKVLSMLILLSLLASSWA